jgi:uncharacterized protein
MKAFFCKLIPPRPSFPSDITPAEAHLMRQHVGYWTDQLSKGCVLVFGPVADPAGSYGIAVIERESEAEARELATNDPVIQANAGFAFELHSMPQYVARG